MRQIIGISASLFVAAAIFCLIFLPEIFNFQVDSDSVNDSLTAENKESYLVTKIIDGDTLIIEGGQRVRLLGIDADENGHPCYGPAKNYLEAALLNKTAVFEREGTNQDIYGRLLRYVFIGRENISTELTVKGLAVARFDSQSKYQKEIQDAERSAIHGRVGCKWQNL